MSNFINMVCILWNIHGPFIYERKNILSKRERNINCWSVINMVGWIPSCCEWEILVLILLLNKKDEYQFFSLFQKRRKKEKKREFASKWLYRAEICSLSSFCLKYYNIIYKNYTNSLKLVLSNQPKKVYEQKQKRYFLHLPQCLELADSPWLNVNKRSAFQQKIHQCLIIFYNLRNTFWHWDFECMEFQCNAGIVEKNPNLELLYAFATQNNLDQHLQSCRGLYIFVLIQVNKSYVTFLFWFQIIW